MEITDIRIKRISDSRESLRAFCSITLDNEFVIRDMKIVDGAGGLFVAMPSRKLTAGCPACEYRNHLRARFCNSCGGRLVPQEPPTDPLDPRANKTHQEIAHPITNEFRELIQRSVIDAFLAMDERAEYSEPETERTFAERGAQREFEPRRGFESREPAETRGAAPSRGAPDPRRAPAPYPPRSAPPAPPARANEYDSLIARLDKGDQRDRSSGRPQPVSRSAPPRPRDSQPTVEQQRETRRFPSANADPQRRGGGDGGRRPSRPSYGPPRDRQEAPRGRYEAPAQGGRDRYEAPPAGRDRYEAPPSRDRYEAPPPPNAFESGGHSEFSEDIAPPPPPPPRSTRGSRPGAPGEDRGRMGESAPPRAPEPRRPEYSEPRPRGRAPRSEEFGESRGDFGAPPENGGQHELHAPQQFGGHQPQGGDEDRGDFGEGVTDRGAAPAPARGARSEQPGREGGRTRSGAGPRSESRSQPPARSAPPPPVDEPFGDFGAGVTEAPPARPSRPARPPAEPQRDRVDLRREVEQPSQATPMEDTSTFGAGL